MGNVNEISRKETWCSSDNLTKDLEFEKSGEQIATTESESNKQEEKQDAN